MSGFLHISYQRGQLIHSGAMPRRSGPPFYTRLYFQVLFGIACGVLLSVLNPHLGAQMKPLGLTKQEEADLVAFMKTLMSDLAPTPAPLLPR